MMVYQSAILQSLTVESEPYFQELELDGDCRELRLSIAEFETRGGTCSSWPAKFKTVVPAWGGRDTLRRGVKRLLARTRLQHFNCLEVTDIRRKYFLGIPYLSISANPRHIQEGSQMQSSAQRAQPDGGEAHFADA